MFGNFSLRQFVTSKPLEQECAVFSKTIDTLEFLAEVGKQRPTNIKASVSMVDLEWVFEGSPYKDSIQIHPDSISVRSFYANGSDYDLMFFSSYTASEFYEAMLDAASKNLESSEIDFLCKKWSVERDSINQF